MQEHLTTVLAGMGGCGASALIAKWAISKALSDLSTLSEKVNHINETLAAIAVRLESLAGIEEQVLEHTKKLAYLEALRKQKNSR